MSELKSVPGEANFNEEEFFGAKPIRWYQIAARNQTIQAIQRGVKRILINLPTGAGKTIAIACTMNSPELRSALGLPAEHKLRVMFLAHTHRLLTQAERTFADDCNVELILQSVMSPITKEVLDKGWDITILDEAHHEACMSMQYQLETAVGDIPLIGLSATPERPDGMVIKFQEFVNPISRERAVEEGWLAETNLYTICDGSERSKAGILCDMFDKYAEQMGGTLVFVKTKAEVTVVADHLRAMGKAAVGLLNQSKEELDQILDSFSAGKVQFIVSCKRLGEGIDVQGCNTIVLGRTLGSYVLLNQIIGRAARPDCDCNVYEIVNPLSATNLDTTCVVGTPKEHKLIYFAKGGWQEEWFDYHS